MGNLLSHVRFADLSEVGGVRYETFFDSIDGWTKVVSGGGSVELSPGWVDIYGASVPAGYARLYKLMNYQYWLPKWNQKRKVRTSIYVEFPAGGDDDNYFGTGNLPPVAPSFGFRIKSNGLYAYSANADGVKEEPVVVGKTPPWTDQFSLEATFHPLSKIQFLINEAIPINIFEKLPVGDDDSCIPLFWIAGGSDNGPIWLQFGSALFFQDL